MIQSATYLSLEFSALGKESRSITHRHLEGQHILTQIVQDGVVAQHAGNKGKSSCGLLQDIVGALVSISHGKVGAGIKCEADFETSEDGNINKVAISS